MMVYHSVFRPVFFKQDPETIHNRLVRLGKVIHKAPFIKTVISKAFYYKHEMLESNLFGIHFKNPVGIAAGFDKNAEMTTLLSSIGFGFLEIGSVTAQPSKGNPKPRIFRLVEDKALINRMGLNNAGAEKVYEKLQKINLNLPLGINIAKSPKENILGKKAVEDFVFSFEKLSGLADYIVLNISCPNTSDGKTFEEPKSLKKLLDPITQKKEKPILVKISPDIDKATLKDIVSVCKDYKVDGFVLTNTSSKRDNLVTKDVESYGKGGLSGKPIKKASTEMIKHVYSLTKGKIPIIGVGGIFNAEDAYEKIQAGASLVQLYTGLVYEGPSIVKKINQGLVSFLKRDGFSNISEAVGTKQ